MLHNLPEGSAAMGKPDQAADQAVAQGGCHVSFRKLTSVFGPSFCVLFV